MNQYMEIAIEEAFKGMKSNEGGPFGAVIVKNNKVISKGHNEVVKSNDPTSHAEINAIRKACKKLKTFNLSNCQIYTSCEPCPMCFAAIHWAKIKTMYYGCTRNDAAKIGFDDKFIYDVIKGTNTKVQLKSIQIQREKCLVPMDKWKMKLDKVSY